MTMMVTELYDAFISAGVSEEKARAAAEVMANYDQQFSEIRVRLGRLTTAVQIAVGAVVIMLISQAGLWSEMGKLGARFDSMSGQISHIEQVVTHLPGAHD